MVIASDYYCRTMTLQQLRDLLAVVAYGGYRAAARALDVSQAGLTKSLANLEAEYSVTFLQRTAKGVLLTPVGEEFVVQARAILQEAERAEEWLQNVNRPATGQIRLGVSIDPSLRLAPAVLKDFRLAFPSTTIHITQRSTSELLAGIRDNRLDLAVTRLPESFESGDLTIHFLYEGRAAIAARKGHPLGAARSVRDLAASEWIVVGNPSMAGQHDESVQELFLRHQLGSPRFAAVSDSLFGAISMLLESDCVARLPSVLLQHPLAIGNLSEIRIKEQVDLAYQVGIVFKAGRRLGREATQLVSMLKSFSRLARALETRRT